MNKNKTPDRDLQDKLLALLLKADKEGLSEAQLAEQLGLTGRARKQFRPVLDTMIARGDIVRIARDRYSLGRPGDLVAGSLEVVRSGNGFVAAEDGSADIFIPKAGMSTSLPGDRVLVRIEPGREATATVKRAGKIVRVLDRSRRAIAGTLRKTGNFFCVVPLDPAYADNFYVADTKDAKPGDRVVIQFTAWDNRHVSPEAEIIERIGPETDPSLDTLAIIKHYGLSQSLPAAAVREAESSPELMDNPGKREDFRNRFIFTIDPATSRDFDDALSLEIKSNGRRELGVHIADVSHFVKPGGAMDAEAKRRGNSVYLPDMVLPMLPEQLSNGLCSLRPNEDRLAFSVMMTFDEKGRHTGSEFRRSIIRSKLRLTYEQALAALDKGTTRGYPEAGVSADAMATIRAIHALAQQLRAQRFARYALELDMPEYEVIMGPDGMISDIRKNVTDISHQLIEECMVAANEAVDRELSGRSVELLRRVHEPPAPHKIELLTAQLIEMGFQPGDLSHRRNLSEFLKSVRGHPFEYDAKILTLKSMMRAVYSPAPLGHYGLAKKFYAHFTSPIRRYPDLVVHRILAAILAGRRTPYGHAELESIGAQSSKTEQVAETAEKTLVEIKKYRFLEQQIRERSPIEYDAIVVNVRSFGMFVELTELGLQGLVPVSSISGNYVRFDEKSGSLKDGSQKYALGTRVKVHVAKVDFDKRKIDFALSGAPEQTGSRRARTNEKRPPRREQPKKKRRRGRR